MNLIPVIVTTKGDDANDDVAAPSKTDVPTKFDVRIKVDVSHNTPNPCQPTTNVENDSKLMETMHNVLQDVSDKIPWTPHSYMDHFIWTSLDGKDAAVTGKRNRKITEDDIQSLRSEYLI